MYDTDKFIWLQGRQVWCFSKLHNTLGAIPDWLDVALKGAHFLEKYGRDASGNWYFSLTREGLPLIEPYNIFSDCYAAMAFGQLYKATSDPLQSFSLPMVLCSLVQELEPILPANLVRSTVTRQGQQVERMLRSSTGTYGMLEYA